MVQVPFHIMSPKLSQIMFFLLSSFFGLFVISVSSHLKQNTGSLLFYPSSLSLFASRHHAGWTNRWREFSAETETDLQSLGSVSHLFNAWCQGGSQPAQGCLCFGYSHIAPGSVSGCSSFADVQGCKSSLRVSLLTCLVWQKLIQNSYGVEKAMPAK